MLMNGMVLTNFQVFNGTHSVDLTTQANKPIVLFGGLNGVGKTTFLTAIRLAFYGKSSFGVISVKEYQKKLISLIHCNGVESNDKASVAVSFDHTQQGQKFTYKIERKWTKKGVEALSLCRDGVLDEYLNTEQVQSFLNDLIPIGVADLFFFDGEKIAELAEDKSGKVLQVAMHKLLGLDVVSRLKNDLKTYLRPFKNQMLPDDIKGEVDNLTLCLSSQKEKVKLNLDLAQKIRVQIKELDSEITTLNEEMMSLGGSWIKTRATEENKLNKSLLRKKEIEQQLHKEFDQAFPLSLAPNMLQKLKNTLSNETIRKQRSLLNSEVQSCKKSIMIGLTKELSEISQNNESINENKNKINTLFEKVVSQVFSSYDEGVNEYSLLLDLSGRETNNIVQQINVDRINSVTQVKQLHVELIELLTDIELSAVNIARAPDESRMLNKKLVFDKLIAKKVKLSIDHEVALNIAQDEVKLAINTAKTIQKKHDELKLLTVDNIAVENSQQALQCLDEFSVALNTLRIKQLEQAFNKSYASIARKEGVKLEAKINVNTFDVELFDENGVVLNKATLSAGEKQIYAIALLDALGNISGHKLPIIIDTPLGRLDSFHRNKLVNNYFTKASHQMIILSTDTEIDKDFFTQPVFYNALAKSYKLCYNTSLRSSIIKEGYFWSTPQLLSDTKELEIINVT